MPKHKQGLGAKVQVCRIRALPRIKCWPPYVEATSSDLTIVSLSLTTLYHPSNFFLIPDHPNHECTFEYVRIDLNQQNFQLNSTNLLSESSLALIVLIWRGWALAMLSHACLLHAWGLQSLTSYLELLSTLRPLSYEYLLHRNREQLDWICRIIINTNCWGRSDIP